MRSDDEITKVIKKRKPSKITLLAGVLLIFYLLIDHFIPDDEPSPAPQVEAVKNITPPELPAPPPTPQLEEVKNEPIEEEIIAPVVEEQQVEEKIETVISPPEIPSELLPDATADEVPPPLTTEAIDEVLNFDTQPEVIPEVIPEAIPENPKDNSMIPKVQGRPEVDYLKPGRGLVYNCSGGHFACVDKASYLECLRFAIWKSQAGNDAKMGCIAFDVYTNDRDCDKAQLYYVSSGKSKPNCE